MSYIHIYEPSLFIGTTGQRLFFTDTQFNKLFLFNSELWVQLSQRAFACVGDVVAAYEVEFLKLWTTSPYFCHTIVGDVLAV